MKRITTKQLEAAIDTLNEKKGTPATPYSKKIDGEFQANIGNYHVSQAYGGNRLDQMAAESGGTRVISMGGYIPKRDLLDQINEMINIL